MMKLLRPLLTTGLFLVFASSLMHATNWYVDPNATGSNNGTSWANAWKSFSAITWSSVNPGDTVYISGGTTSQTYTSALTIGKSGTSGSPITIAAGQDSGHNGTVIFDGGGGTAALINFGSNQYVTLDGNFNGSRHIIVQNNSLSGDNPLIYGIGSQSANMQGDHITYVEVASSGTGIRMLYAKGTEIDHSYVHNISCEAAVDLDGSLANYSGDLSQYNLYDLGALVHDNTLSVNNAGADSGYGPDIIQGTHGISVYNNSLTGITGPMSCSQHQDAIQLGGSFYKVYNNYFNGTANSDMESDWSDTTCGFTRVWNNVFTESLAQKDSHAIEMDQHTSCTRLTDFRIYNNHFVDFTGFIGVRLLIDSSSSTLDNMVIQNNIFYNVGTPISLANGTYSCGSGVVIDSNNINAGAHGTNGITCDGTSYAATNTQSGAPVFVSYAEYGLSNDYHLQSTSTADLGKGVNLSNWFTTDKDGTPRPATGPWDIGAYDPSTGAGGPNPPSGLNALVQ